MERLRARSAALLRLVVIALAGVLAATAWPSATTTFVHVAKYSYDVPSVSRVDVQPNETAKPSSDLRAASQDSPISRSAVSRGASTTPSHAFIATNTVDDVFHYTSGEFVDSISANGLRPGSYATPNGSLSPLQAQIDLALPPNTGLRDAVMRVDVAGLREAGYEIPSITQVTGTVTGPGGRIYTMPGGGYEMQFPYAIPPEFIKVVTGG